MSFSTRNHEFFFHPLGSIIIIVILFLLKTTLDLLDFWRCLLNSFWRCLFSFQKTRLENRKSGTRIFSFSKKFFPGGDHSRRGLLRLRGAVARGRNFGSRAGGEHAMNQLQFSSDLRVFMIQIPGSSEWPFGFWHFQGWILERPFRKTLWKTEK